MYMYAYIYIYIYRHDGEGYVRAGGRQVLLDRALELARRPIVERPPAGARGADLASQGCLRCPLVRGPLVRSLYVLIQH